MTVALLFVSFGLLLLIGVPIVWCMAVASLVAVLLGQQWSDSWRSSHACNNTAAAA